MSAASLPPLPVFEDGTVDVERVPSEWKQVFKAAGVRKKDLLDPAFTARIYDALGIAPTASPTPTTPTTALAQQEHVVHVALPAATITPKRRLTADILEAILNPAVPQDVQEAAPLPAPTSTLTPAPVSALSSRPPPSARPPPVPPPVPVPVPVPVPGTTSSLGHAASPSPSPSPPVAFVSASVPSSVPRGALASPRLVSPSAGTPAPPTQPQPQQMGQSGEASSEAPMEQTLDAFGRPAGAVPVPSAARDRRVAVARSGDDVLAPSSGAGVRPSTRLPAARVRGDERFYLTADPFDFDRAEHAWRLKERALTVHDVVAEHAGRAQKPKGGGLFGSKASPQSSSSSGGAGAEEEKLRWLSDELTALLDDEAKLASRPLAPRLSVLRALLLLLETVYSRVDDVFAQPLRKLVRDVQQSAAHSLSADLRALHHVRAPPALRCAVLRCA